MSHALEDIQYDHPGILGQAFVPAGVCRCKQYSASPYVLQIERRGLAIAETAPRGMEVAWAAGTEIEADRLTRTLQSPVITEFAAVALLCIVFPHVEPGVVTGVTKRGQGVDYWLDGRRAVVEVSGEVAGDISRLEALHARKKEQLARSMLRASGQRPGFVFVVCFEAQRAILSYHR